MIGNLPIQGGERVIFTLDNVKGEVVEYELYVYKVYNRVVDKNRQMYNLALLSKEAMTNEAARVTKKMKAHPEQIVADVLKTNLGVQEDKIFAETSKFKMSMFPNGRKPHAIIQSLMARTVPKSSKFKKGGGAEDAQPGGELGTNATKASGTAGYLFFQNADGFVFKSMDLLCSDGSDTFGGSAPVAEY